MNLSFSLVAVAGWLSNDGVEAPGTDEARAEFLTAAETHGAKEACDALLGLTMRAPVVPAQAVERSMQLFLALPAPRPFTDERFREVLGYTTGLTGLRTVLVLFCTGSTSFIKAIGPCDLTTATNVVWEQRRVSVARKGLGDAEDGELVVLLMPEPGCTEYFQSTNEDLTAGWPEATKEVGRNPYYGSSADLLDQLEKVMKRVAPPPKE